MTVSTLAAPLRKLSGRNILMFLAVLGPGIITANVDDVPLMECRYGQQGGQYALKIERFIASESQEAALGENNG